MHYVVIGNSAAAIGAIEAIRKYDEAGLITVVSEEPYPTYSRPLISYFLAGKIEEEEMFYQGRNFAKEKGVEMKLGQAAIRLDLSGKMVQLTNHEMIPFDKLLIATGGVPLIPKVKGRDLKGVFSLSKWDDAKRIKGFMERNRVRRAVVIGGGLIGLRAAEALTELRINVAIVELTDRMLSTTLDKVSSQILEDALKEKGIEIFLNNTVAQIECDTALNGPSKEKKMRVSKIVFGDGKKMKTDLVIFAAGVRPNVALIKDTSVKINKGIVVDEYMQTSVPNVYAGGDVTEVYDLVTGMTRSIPIWPNAYRQGHIAACNATGEKKKYEGGLAMNAVEICGISTISVGLTQPREGNYEVLEYCDTRERQYRKIVLREGTIVGAIFMGKIDRAGIITSLIKNRINVSSFKDHLMREDVGLIFLSSEHRKHMVSGKGIEV